MLVNNARRAFIGGALAAIASPRLLRADDDKAESSDNSGESPNNPFILLLRGIYESVPHLPDLGLSGVDLNDPTYMKTKIYPIYGIQGSRNQENPIGEFYGSNTNLICVYDLPGGAIAMSFATSPVIPAIGFNTFVPFPDGQGGNYLEATFELTITDATGAYKSFKGGHNHMVDRLHQINATTFDEFCFCNISKYPFP